MECYDSGYYEMMAVAILFTLLYCCGIPVAVVAVLMKAKRGMDLHVLYSRACLCGLGLCWPEHRTVQATASWWDDSLSLTTFSRYELVI